MQPDLAADLVIVWDAEFCPDPIPDNLAACMIYIGGSSAAHVWDADELARVAHLPRLPIWVPTPGQENPRHVAALADRRMTELGIPRGLTGDGDKAGLMWDMETGKEPDPRWLELAADRLTRRGRANLPYGSPDTVFAYEDRAGYVVATDSGAPNPYPHPDVLGTQYAFDVPTPGGLVDLSVFTKDSLRYFWQPA